MDIQKHKITHLAAATATGPRIQIEAVVTDSTTGAVLFDFTGANAIMFPADLAGYTQARRHVFIQIVAQWMIYEKAGLNS